MAPTRQNTDLDGPSGSADLADLGGQVGGKVGGKALTRGSDHRFFSPWRITVTRPTPFPDQTVEPATPPAPQTPWRRTRCHRSDPYIAALHDEWARLAEGLELEPDVLSLLDQARRHHQATIDCLDDLVATMHGRGDAPLLFAIEAAQAGSYIAARAIIQAMLPKLGRLAHSVRRGRSFSTVIAEAVAAMYEVIYRYPIDRRPCSVAANLALDTLKSLRLILGSELPASEILAGLLTATNIPIASSTAPDPAGGDELVEVLADAQHQGFVSSAEVRLLWLVAMGSSQVEVACQLGITPAALRQRYHRACALLRGHAAELAA